MNLCRHNFYPDKCGICRLTETLNDVAISLAPVPDPVVEPEPVPQPPDPDPEPESVLPPPPRKVFPMYTGPLTEHDLMDLVETTGWLFPAGEWTDIQAHLPVLYSLARWCNATAQNGRPVIDRPPRCLEIGVRQGVSTVAILLAMRRTGGTLISLDIDPVETAEARKIIDAAGLAAFWDFRLMHSDAFTSEDPFDFAWIDGDHHDPQPTKDFEHIAPMVRVGGMIAMHDYFVEDWREDAGGVARAVEFAKASGQYEVCTLPWSYGCTILRKLGR